MAAPLLFYDLSLLPSSSAGDNNSTLSSSSSSTSTSSSSRLQLLSATARALELGYAAVALDHPHRGLLADSHRCRTHPFAPLSSLPLPPSAALHRRRLGCPVSEPFRQLTRVTLALDSAAAAASALAPSAARLLRTYDLVAARPLTQPAFDYLCQAPHHLDLVSIDFASHGKLPFRIKPPMLKLALQKGMHFEIAYSPLISSDASAKRNLLAEVKLLVEWTKGKNLIISSAAHTGSQIRGPYDVINLAAYLLGLPINRAKAAISTNCRSLVLKALKKKHFYKETIRVDRLLPDEQLTSTKFKLVDWIAWTSVPSQGGVNPLEPSSNFDELPGSPIHGAVEESHEEPQNFDVPVFAKLSEQYSDQERTPPQTQEETLPDERTEGGVNPLEPASNFGELPGSPIHGAVEGSHEEPQNFDVPVFAKLSEQCCDQEQIPPQTQEETLPFERTEVLISCVQPILPTSFNYQNDPFVQADADCCVNLKSIVKHVESAQDVMEVDATESHELNVIVEDNIHSTSGTSINFLSCGLELSGTSLDDQRPCQSSEMLANAQSSTKYHTDFACDEREKSLLDHEIPSGSVVCPEDKDLDQSNDMQVDAEIYRSTSEPVECPPSGADEKASLDLAFYSSPELHRDVIIQGKVMEGKVERIMDENIEQGVKNETKSIDKGTRTSISVEPVFHGQEISSTSHKRSTDTSCESDELKEQNSEETNASLEKSVAKTHELLPKFSYPSAEVEMSTIRSEKRRRTLKLYRPAYLPFLGFLRSVHFKKKICKVKGLIKHA